jgi:hypothetical protein
LKIQVVFDETFSLFSASVTTLFKTQIFVGLLTPVNIDFDISFVLRRWSFFYTKAWLQSWGSAVLFCLEQVVNSYIKLEDLKVRTVQEITFGFHMLIFFGIFAWVFTLLLQIL